MATARIIMITIVKFKITPSKQRIQYDCLLTSCFPGVLACMSAIMWNSPDCTCIGLPPTYNYRSFTRSLAFEGCSWLEYLNIYLNILSLLQKYFCVFKRNKKKLWMPMSPSSSYSPSLSSFTITYFLILVSLTPLSLILSEQSETSQALFCLSIHVLGL